MQITNSKGRLVGNIDYNVGDIVYISHSGLCYTTYEEAFRFFGLDYNRRDLELYRERDQLYQVIGFVEHGHCLEIMCKKHLTIFL